MANTQINIINNGKTTLATEGKWCDRNIDVNVNVPTEGTGTDTSDANAVASDIKSGSTAYVNGQKITGNVQSVDSLVVDEYGAPNFNTEFYPDTISITAPIYNSSPIYIEPDSAVEVHANAPLFGDASPSDVAVGKRFTSVNGLNIIGTKENVPAQADPVLQEKSVSPAETAVSVVADSGYDGLSRVNVGAVQVENKNVTPQTETLEVVPSSGTYLKKVTVNPIPSLYVNTSDANAVASQILYGRSAYVNGTKVIGGMPDNGTISVTIDGLTDTGATVPSGYTSGGTVSLTDDIKDALSALSGNSEESIADGLSNADIAVNTTQAGLIAQCVAALEGKSAVSATLQNKTIIENGTYSADSGYDGLGSITVNVPTGVARSISDVTASGATVSIPAGLYASSVSKSVASGTAGTPTAAKTINGGVATITPSVTNTAGYISGGSKTGTAVTVSASELVSGTQNITENGTYDVTDESSVVVNVNGKNTQAYHGMNYSRQTTLTSTGVSLTVAKTGTYKVSWMGFRNTTSGTSSSQLYINGTAYGTANTTFTSSYGQTVTLNNVSLTEGQTVEVYGRARSTSYYMYVGNLIIEEM